MESQRDRRHWRGGQATRIEALTDAVFGFAITLLVVTLEVPATFDQLIEIMRGFLAFACSFALLILVWTYHYRLFGRYDLEDGWTILLNSILLFVVLFYVYPLKFVFTSWLGSNMNTAFATSEQVPLVMAIYGTGFVAVFVVFALLYLNAYRQRESLGLGPIETVDTLAHVSDCAVMIGVGLLSILIARVAPLAWAAPAAGFIYFLIGPLQYLNGWYFARRRQRLEAAILTPAGIDHVP